MKNWQKENFFARQSIKRGFLFYSLVSIFPVRLYFHYTNLNCQSGSALDIKLSLPRCSSTDTFLLLKLTERRKPEKHFSHPPLDNDELWCARFAAILIKLFDVQIYGNWRRWGGEEISTMCESSEGRNKQKKSEMLSRNMGIRGISLGKKGKKS